MEKIYLEGILDRARKELKIKSDDYELRAGRTGKKMTIDGINYFNEILGVEIYYNNILLGEYDLEKKSLKKKINTMDVIALEKFCNLVNDFVGFYKYGVNYEALKKYEDFKDSLDEGLSEKEVMDMYRWECN